MARRHVLFAVLDTVRRDHRSGYGYDRSTSPELAAFAGGARVYEEAIAPAPWTLPVRASMFAGPYPSEHGATQEAPHLDGTTTLAESLSAAGYDTGCYSSNAWITPCTDLTAGFDRRDNCEEFALGVDPDDPSNKYDSSDCGAESRLSDRGHID